MENNEIIRYIIPLVMFLLIGLILIILTFIYWKKATDAFIKDCSGKEDVGFLGHTINQYRKKVRSAYSLEEKQQVINEHPEFYRLNSRKIKCFWFGLLSLAISIFFAVVCL